MPKGFCGFEEPANWLNFDEIERLVAVLGRLEVHRVRVTGGEPLLRSGATEDQIEAAIRTGIELKPQRHEFRELPGKIIRLMSKTGG